MKLIKEISYSKIVFSFIGFQNVKTLQSQEYSLLIYMKEIYSNATCKIVKQLINNSTKNNGL